MKDFILQVTAAVLASCWLPTITVSQNMTEQLIYSCDYSMDLCGAVTDFWIQEDRPAAGRPVSGPLTGSDSNAGYLYFPSISCSQPGDKHNVEITFAETPPTANQSRCCLTFNFHVWGPDIREISLDHKRDDGRIENDVWRIEMTLTDKWFQAEVLLENCGTKIIFNGNCGAKGHSDLAIDNVAVYSMPCPGIQALPYHCGFEDDDPLCGFQQQVNDDGEWRRVTSPNPYRNATRLTGPETGFRPDDFLPTGTNTSHFMLMHAPDLAQNNYRVSLKSPLFNAVSTSCCVSFGYYMYGDNRTFGSLEVFVADLRFRRRYSLKDSWETGMVSLRSCQGYVEFTATRGDVSSDLMDIAIDEVWVTPGLCDGENTDLMSNGKYQCYFSQTYCGLVQINRGADWMVHQGESVSRALGADTGPTIATTWHYLYLSAYIQPAGQYTAIVQLSLLKSESEVCIEFNYYMSGGDVQQLSVYTTHKENPKKTVIQEFFVQNYDMGSKWRHYSRTFQFMQRNYLLTIEGIVLGQQDSDLALTNLTITPGPCATDLGKLGPLPWSCDFEDDDDFWCHLQQTRLDETEQGWRKSAVIPTRRDNGTGPSVDHSTATRTGNMMYFSTTLTNGEQRVGMRLPTPTVDGNSTAEICLMFYYYMFGENTSQLALFYDDGTYLTDNAKHIWHQTFNQGDLWRNENLTLNAALLLPVFFAASSVVDGLSDIAIDDVSVTPAACENPTNEQDYLPYQCDFEYGWCNMQQVNGDGIDWRWQSGLGLSRAKGYYTGPASDANSSIDGHYAYYQSSLSNEVQKYAAITTPKLTLPNSTVCFSFRYHMYGKDVGMLRLDQLIPYLDSTGFEKYTTTYLWHASFAFPDHWYLYMKTFKDFTGKVKISARNYYSYAPQGDIAVDDITITNGTCQDNLEVYSRQLPFVCNFETTICNFKQFIKGTESGDDGDFRWQGGIAVSRKDDLATGPLFDATYNSTLFANVDIYNFQNLTLCEDLYSMNTTNLEQTNSTQCVNLPKAYYIYFRQNDHDLGTSKHYIISTPIMDIGNQTICLSFRYHMYGYDVNRLTVLNERPDMTQEYLWHQRYDHGDVWWKTDLTVPDMQGRIIFKVDGGSGQLADIAIDDVMLTSGPCPLDTGFTADPLPWSCDFETDFCDVVHEFYDDTDEWRWQRGESRSRGMHENTGPLYDATFGNASGHYALFDATDVRSEKDFSFLKTPVFNYSTSVPEVCLSFRYYGYGYAVDSLWVFIDRNSSDANMEYIWHTSFTQSDTWYRYAKTVKNFTGQIVFKGVRGPGVNGDLAIDDILITEGHCTEAVGDYLQNVSYSCDFESSYCDMTQSVNNEFDWRRHRGPPGRVSATYHMYTVQSGATEDHTNGTINGYSLHLQSYYATGSLWASEISTPNFNASRPTVCLDFYYHMYGSSVYLLELYWQPDIANDTLGSYVWHQAYDQDNEWFHFYRSLPDFQGRLIFIGHSGVNRLSFIELDDLSIYPAPCKDPELLSVPLNCSFEHGFCFLEQNRHNDTGDFHRPKGSSLGRLKGQKTGPPVDHTYECTDTNGKYVYLYKRQCPDCEGKSAKLDSMKLNVEGQSVICLQFWYYLYGSTVDTLRWSVIENDSITDIWSLSGDHGEDWDLVQLNVTVSSPVIRLRLEGIYGSGLDSDIALDDLSIYGGHCVPVPECNATLLPVAHSTVLIEGTSYGDLANYTCDIGYRFPDGTKWNVRVCDNAEWRCPLQDCQIIYCPSLPSRAHLHWSSTNREWNTTVAVTCDSYYRLSDPVYDTVTCLDTEQWDKDISKISCNLIHCPGIPDVENGTWFPSRNNTVTSRIELKCSENYTFINASFSNFTCLRDGRWSMNISLAGCRPHVCPELPTLPLLTWDTRLTFYKTVVHPTCSENYTPSNKSYSLTCLAEEVWNNSTAIEESISCVLKRCPALPSLPYLEWSTNETLYKTAVRPACQSMYRLSDPDYSLYCTQDEKWNNTIAIEEEIRCEKIRCPDLPSLNNGNWSTLNTSVSVEVRPVCSENYNLSGVTADVFNCTDTGHWSIDINSIKCTATSCPVLPNLENGNWSTTQRTINTVVEIQCHPDYYLTPPQYDNVTCTESGTWDKNPSQIACINVTSVVSCPPIPTNEAGYPDTNMTAVNSVVNIICREGYVLPYTNASTIRCQENGTWSRNITEIFCKPLVLGCPPIPTNEAGYPDTNVTTVNSVVNIICREGYVLVDPSSSTVRCQEDGTWSKNLPEIFCKPTVVSCPPIPTNEAGYPDTNMTTVNSVVNIICHEGYALPHTNASTITCQENGMWSRNITEIFCKPLDDTLDLHIYDNQVLWLRQQGLPEICLVLRAHRAIPRNYTEDKDRYLVAYSCEKGYAFRDESQTRIISCDKYGVWRNEQGQLDYLHCKETACPEIELTPGTQRDSSSHWYGDKVTYYCDVGYQFEDGTTRRSLICLADNRWSSIKPVCRPISCNPVDGHNICESGAIKSGSANKVYGDVLEICCDPDHRMIDGRQSALSTCSSDGKWYPDISQCTRSSCNPVPYVSHSTYVITARNVTHTVVTYHCDYGYSIKNGITEYTLTCNGKQEGWNYEDIKQCLNVTCPRIQHVRNADLDTDITIWGTIVTLTCHHGYRVANRSSYQARQLVECLATGNWNTSIDNCEEIICPTPEAIRNTSLSYNSTIFNSLAYYTCNEGLRYADGTSTQVVQCGNEMQWSKLKSSCEINRCPPPPKTRHMEYTNISVEIGAYLTPVCEDGYLMSPNDTNAAISCLPTKQWSPLMANCSPIDCGPLPLGEHMLKDNSNTVFLSKVTVTTTLYYMFTVNTNSSFQLEDKFIISNVTCLSNRTWSVDLREINTTVVRCNDTPRVPFALPDRIELPLYGGSEIGYRCAENYRFPDRTTWMAIHCLPNGTWETPRGCEMITCPSLGAWQELIVEPLPINYTVGSILNISCPDGYKMENGLTHMFTKCVGLGDWKPEPSSCWQDNQMEIVVVESEVATQIGVPLIILLVIIFGFFVVSDIVSYRRDIYRFLLDVPRMPRAFALNLKLFIRNVKALRQT